MRERFSTFVQVLHRESLEVGYSIHVNNNKSLYYVG